MSKIDLTAERLRELLNYDPETGVFTRRVTRRRWKAGTSIGWLMNTGYVAIVVDSRQYLAHRLAWLYMTGAWPVKYIDHLDCTRTNNRYANLREADHYINQQNQRAPKSHNQCGYLGVVKHGSRYRAKLSVNGAVFLLGTADTPEEAHELYKAGKAKMHPGSTL